MSVRRRTDRTATEAYRRGRPALNSSSSDRDITRGKAWHAVSRLAGDGQPSYLKNRADRQTYWFDGGTARRA